MLVCCAYLYYRTKTKGGTTSSMWITSQEGPAVEIIHFEKIGLTTFVWVWVSFQTIHWSVSCPATTTYLCWLCHIPLLDKEIYFVCLFTVAFPSE